MTTNQDYFLSLIVSLGPSASFTGVIFVLVLTAAECTVAASGEIG